MTTTTRRVQGAGRQAHRDSISQSTASITGFLNDLLGNALVAHIANVDKSTVSRWKSGTAPGQEAERRLRGTHQVCTLLLAGDADHTVRAWFIGNNPQLDDEAPADVLREGDIKAVLSAARSYVDGG